MSNNVDWKLKAVEGNPKTEGRYWVAFLDPNGAARVTDLTWFMRTEPDNFSDEDLDENMLYSEDCEPYWPFGWHSAHSHPEFSDYYQSSDLDVFAYAEMVRPSAPELD